MSNCSICGGTVELKICSTCGNLEKIDSRDNYFNFFGMEVSPEIDLERLERLYHELSRKFHPDFFTRKEKELRLRSLELSSYLNNAYKTLKNRIERLKYIMRLYGVNEESNGNPAEMAEFFEINEAIEEMSTAGSESLRDEIEQKLIKLERDLEDELKEISHKWEKADGKKKGELAVRLSIIISRLSFLHRAQARKSEFRV